jgi:hypothetical protein
MAIRESDSDDARQKIDHQDRLDAEEIMVSAMMDSVSSSSRSSGDNNSNKSQSNPATKIASTFSRHQRISRITSRSGRSSSGSSSQLSISRQRREQPPSIPPPALPMEPLAKSTQKGSNIWKCRYMISLGIVGLLVVGIAAVLIVVVVKPNLSFVTSKEMSDSVIPILHVNQPIRLKRISSFQPRQTERTKFLGTKIPSFYQSTVKRFDDTNHTNDVPVLWRIPWSGDEAWTEIMGVCLDLNQMADEQEIIGTHLMNPDLVLVLTDRGTYFNVDLSNHDGINQAKSMNLVALQQVDVVTSPWLFPMLGLFDSLEQRKARAFVTLRHPAARLTLYFYEAQDFRSRYYNPHLENMTIDQYSTWPEDRMEFNFMVKSLVSSSEELIPTDGITTQDLQLAQQILQDRFMILLADDKYGSWAKLEAYLGWPYTTLEQRHCEDTILRKEWPQVKDDRPLPPPLGANEQAYLHLMERNQWDVQLYEFAMQLFKEQSERLVT